MTENLHSILSGCLDPAKRQESENAVQAMAGNPNFPRELITIALGEGSFAERQLAVVTLKNFIDSNWSSVQIKDWVKLHILHGLADPNQQIRSSFAYAVSKIAHTDWPEQWPDLFDHLMALISTQELHKVHGALQVLSEFVRDDLSDNQFPHIAPVLIPVLLSIFNSNSCTAEIRAKSVSIIRNFIEMINMVRDEYPEALSSYLDPILRTWMPGFAATLDSEFNPEEIMVFNEVLRTVLKIFQLFPKNTLAYTVEFFGLTWKALALLQKEYCKQYIYVAKDSWSDEYELINQESELCSLETVIISMIEIIQLLSKKSTFKPFLKSEFFSELFHTFALLIQISAASENAWTDDLDAFIQDDQEESLNYNVRSAALQCLVVQSFNLVIYISA
jgi:hypothetical protein